MFFLITNIFYFRHLSWREYIHLSKSLWQHNNTHTAHARKKSIFSGLNARSPNQQNQCPSSSSPNVGSVHLTTTICCTQVVPTGFRRPSLVAYNSNRELGHFLTSFQVSIFSLSCGFVFMWIFIRIYHLCGSCNGKLIYASA